MGDALPLLRGAMARERGYYRRRLAYLSEAYLREGRFEEVIRLAEQFYHRSHDRKERGYEAWALRLLGEIASHRDPPEVEKAEDHYHQALALAAELGMRPLVAQIHLELGGLYRRTGERAKAREHLTIASGLFREMGRRVWVGRRRRGSPARRRGKRRQFCQGRGERLELPLSLRLPEELGRQLAAGNLRQRGVVGDFPDAPVLVPGPPVRLGLGEALQFLQDLSARRPEIVPERLNRRGKGHAAHLLLPGG